MEVLRFVPAQSPLRRATFSGSEPFSATVAVAVAPSPILSNVKELGSAAPLSPPLPEEVVPPSSLQCESGYLLPNRYSGNSAGGDGTLNAMEYLTSILSSKVYDVAYESPLQLASKLSDRLGANVWLKREDFQPVFSFKIRGAYNMMAKLSKEQLERGVICSSAGNHAQGVVLAAQKLGCNAVIVMPVTTPEIKWRSVERLGATVVIVGDSYDEAQAFAKKQAEEEGRTFVPPFDHPGGGGLIAGNGIAAYVKRVSPEVKIIGVEPFDANAMALSLHHGPRVVLDHNDPRDVVFAAIVFAAKEKLGYVLGCQNG
ncbi:hypothetical protein SASPL_102206 [Salvia splendens]|uniref:Tryptophan synthase beta chain-like PALP domain-containing protein n=1 Tax=Salvia splendens TaxID=180675 RepID=A0A8X9ACM0_SALSN|nr:hypothetical protein SASPL_102206 [Salvia splendens]